MCREKKQKPVSPGAVIGGCWGNFSVGFIKKKKKRQKETDVKGVSDTISAKISHAALSQEMVCHHTHVLKIYSSHKLFRAGICDLFGAAP